jgi:hypothetical protein
MCAISTGMSERKNMFILEITGFTQIGFVYSDFDVSKKYSVVGESPDLFLCFLVRVISSLCERPKDLTVEDLIAEHDVRQEHVSFRDIFL